MRSYSIAATILLLSPTACFSQLPSSRCDSTNIALEDCTSLTQFEAVKGPVSTSYSSSLDRSAVLAEYSGASTDTYSQPDSGQSTTPAGPGDEHFHWGRALTESFTFLVIEQAYVVHTDFNWVVSENGIPLNHYWRDYKQSLSSWNNAGWSAGEDPLYNYVGHPIQGALTSYIEIQNDPKSRRLEYSNTKAYWWSRIKASLWNTVYSTQWSIGPLSEMTVEKYGTKDRPPWNANGSFPCNTNTCYSGVGKVNLVMTPLGGFGWILGEDVLDKEIMERIEAHTGNRLLIDTVRTALNPIRGGANILHGKRVWYRPRDDHEMSFLTKQKTSVSTSEIPKTVPAHGDVFFGYTHLGVSHCENPYSGVALVCDPLSAKASNLGGWNVAVEKKYLHYFGVVADVSGQYGGTRQNNYLFGIRGGATIGRFRPFSQVLFGAVNGKEFGPLNSGSDTSFAEDLGMGIDSRLTRLLGWRVQVDALKTGLPNFERYNVRVSSGLGVRF